MPYNFSQSGTEDIKNFAPVSLDEAEQIIDYLKAKPLILSHKKAHYKWFSFLKSNTILMQMKNSCYTYIMQEYFINFLYDK